MVDSGAHEPHADINEAVRSAWEGETTPAERVKEVIRHTYTPARAEAIAEQALTTTKTARKHLETFAADGFVTTTPGEHGATLYRRSSESLITERATRLLSEHSIEALSARVSEMRAEIHAYRKEYGVDSPEELAIRLGNQALDGTEADPPVDESAVTEWQTTRRNLAFANAALSIAQATDYVAGDAQGTPAVNSQ